MRLRGRGGWIWYVDACGGAAGIVARARRARLSFVLVKGADGGDLWRQLDRTLVDELRAAGLVVLGWAYCYGDDPEAEAAAAERILAAGVDGLVADVEAEYEGKAAAAERYATLGRALCGDRLFGYAPLPVVDLHQRLPYAQLNRACDVVMPQMYTRALGADDWPLGDLFAMWERWRDTWAGWGVPTPPIAPVGEAFGRASPDDVRSFEAAVAARGVAAHSYWALDHATDRQLEAMSAWTSGGGAGVTAALDGIWAETEALARIGHIDQARAIQQQVIALKEAIGHG